MADLTQAMFDKLLRRLDPDRDRAGEKYNGLQLRLVKLFQWRGRALPERHAQEVINRVAQRIDEGEEIADLDKYVNVVARYVLLETLRQQEKERQAHDRLTEPPDPPPDPAERDREDDCFRDCLGGLPAGERRLMEEYFQGEKSAKIENRKQMAGRLGISPNALRIRCLRVRERLKACFRECAGRPAA